MCIFRLIWAYIWSLYLMGLTDWSPIFSIVFFRQLVEVTPAFLVTLGVVKFVFGEPLHSFNVLLNFTISEIRNCNFSQINGQESLDGIPIFDVSFCLSDSFEYKSLLFSLVILTFKHIFEYKFTLAKLLVHFPITCQSLDGILFSDHALFLLSYSCYQSCKP